MITRYSMYPCREDSKGIWVLWDDVKQLIPKTPPVPKEDKCPFKVGDIIKYAGQLFEVIELEDDLEHEFILCSTVKGQTHKHLLPYDCVLATPEERAQFMDEKYSRMIGDVKVRASIIIHEGLITLSFRYYGNFHDRITLNCKVGEAICKALDIPICEGDPVYPL